MEGAILTPEEYAETRDAFAAVAKDIERLQSFAFDTIGTPPAGYQDSREAFAAHLDEYGFYMTGDDYLAVEEARQLFARLAGLNAARAL